MLTWFFWVLCLSKSTETKPMDVSLPWPLGDALWLMQWKWHQHGTRTHRLHILPSSTSSILPFLNLAVLDFNIKTTFSMGASKNSLLMQLMPSGFRPSHIASGCKGDKECIQFLRTLNTRKRRKIVALINKKKKKKKKPLKIFGNYSVDSSAILKRLGLATLCHLFFALFNPRRVVHENLAWNLRSRMSLRTRTPALGRTGVRVCQRHRAVTCSCQVKNPSKSIICQCKKPCISRDINAVNE